MLREVAGEGEHGVDDGGDGVPDVAHVAVIALDRLHGVLPGDRRPDQPAGRLHADPQGVLAEQRRGVRVVRRDGGLAGAQCGCDVGRQEGLHVVGAEQPAEHLAHARAQLRGRLAREGESENPVRLDEAVRYQPHDPHRHRLGLARPGPGDDDERLGRSLDGQDLLRRRWVLLTEPARQLGRTEATGRTRLVGRRGRDVGRRHAGASVTVRPSSRNGQLVRTGHRSQ